MNANTLLYESFDRQLSSEEQAFLQQALAQDPALREEQAQLLLLREGMAQLQASPKIGFADTVMAKINEQQSGGVIRHLAQLFPRVAAAAIVVATLTLLSIYWNSGSLDSDSLIGYQDLQPEEAAYVLDD